MCYAAVMNKRRTLGFVSLAAYIGTIFAANWAIARFGIVPVGFGQDFQRHLAAEPLVRGEVYLPHGAASQSLLDLVLADPLTGANIMGSSPGCHAKRPPNVPGAESNGSDVVPPGASRGRRFST